MRTAGDTGGLLGRSMPSSLPQPGSPGRSGAAGLATAAGGVRHVAQSLAIDPDDDQGGAQGQLGEGARMADPGG